MTELVEFERVKEAAARIKGKVCRTPLLRMLHLDPYFHGAQVYIKPESFQPIGSFKIRGATNKILDLVASGEEIKGVITVSSGNHAQGVAWAAANAGLNATVVMPEIASPLKVEKTRALGAEVILYGQNNNESDVKALEIAEREGLSFVHAYHDPLIIAGQGTAGLEIMEDEPDMDVVICPVGGGGLMSGVALAVKSMNPATAVYGVEPALVPRFAESQKAGELLTLSPDQITIADGTRTMTARELNFNMIDTYVDHLFSVREEMIADALALMTFETKLLIEPSSAMAFAAALFGRIPLEPGTKVCFVLSGGNISFEALEQIMAQRTR
jgi:threonine dehydratase